MFEQCLKLLNTFSFCFKDMFMFSIWQCHEITGTIVIANTIQVMYYPPGRQRLFIDHFPYKEMFPYIAFIGSRMSGFTNQDITIFCRSAAFPAWILFSQVAWLKDRRTALNTSFRCAAHHIDFTVRAKFSLAMFTIRIVDRFRPARETQASCFTRSTSNNEFPAVAAGDCGHIDSVSQYR